MRTLAILEKDGAQLVCPDEFYRVNSVGQVESLDRHAKLISKHSQVIRVFLERPDLAHDSSAALDQTSYSFFISHACIVLMLNTAGFVQVLHNSAIYRNTSCKFVTCRASYPADGALVVRPSFNL